MAREVQRNRSKKGARAVDLVRRGKSAKEKIRASLQVDRCDGAIPPYPPLSPPTMPVEQTIPVKKRVLPLYTGWDSDDSEVEVVKVRSQMLFFLHLMLISVAPGTLPHAAP